jgi:hypothetical protein
MKKEKKSYRGKENIKLFSKIPKGWKVLAPPTGRFSNFCMEDNEYMLKDIKELIL